MRELQQLPVGMGLHGSGSQINGQSGCQMHGAGQEGSVVIVQSAGEPRAGLQHTPKG